MQYQNVCLESFGYVLPEERITSADLERRLAPAYERLKLPAGRLELMTGIRERRFFPAGVIPSDISIRSAQRAIDAAGLHPLHIGALAHGSVCRDQLEPATGCRVHDAIGLPPDCLVYDVSNACLGLLTGVLNIANMIELGHIRAGLVVGTECGRALVENTIERINADASIDRRAVKQFVASLTIGSASVAMLLCDRELSETGNRIEAAAVRAHTHDHGLCLSDGHDYFMRTDSEQLMLAGVEAGVKTFERFLAETEWTRTGIDKTACHQVGIAHRKLLFESLGLSESIDFSTFETLGNTGAAALPVTMALAAETGRLRSGDRIAMLGIGSGINCQMIGVRWQEAKVSGEGWDEGNAVAACHPRATTVLPEAGV